MTKAARSNSKWRRGFTPPELCPDFVLFSERGPCSHAYVIQRIAEKFNLRVDPLPNDVADFNGTKLAEDRPGGVYVCGSAAWELDKITVNYRNLYWLVSDGILRFEVRTDGGKPRSPFDEVAGRLMTGAQTPGKQLARSPQLLLIADELTASGFTLSECLTGSVKNDLADWNRRFAKAGKAILTFRQALECLNPLNLPLGEEGRFKPINIRRALLQRLNRARERYRESHPLN